MIAKGTGLQESMQIGRLADSVTEQFGEAMEKHGLKKKTTNSVSWGVQIRPRWGLQGFL